MKPLFSFIFFLAFIVSYSQEPPAYFMFNYKNIAESSEDLLNKYDIISYCNRGSSEPIEYFANYINNESLYLDRYFLIDGYIIFEIGGYIPNTNDIAVLVLKEKHTNKYFTLHIRFSKLLKYGEIVFLEDLIFKNGDFFYDCCTSKMKYEIESVGQKREWFIEDNYDYFSRYKISLNDLKYHKISKSKLDRFLKKYVCEN